MDNFFKIIPFLVPLWVMYIVYKQYKNKRNAVEEYEKRLAWFDKNRWLRYIKTIYIDRGVVRFWSAIWYVPLLFCGFVGIVLTVGSLESYILPSIPLENMKTMNGKILTIKERRKMPDLLILQTKSGQKDFFISASDSEKKT